MQLQLVTLSGVKVDRDVYEVTLSTEAGEISVLPGHEPLVTLAIPGSVSVRHARGDRDDDRDLFVINGGVVEISQQRVRILVDEAEHADELVEAEIRQALDHAREMRATASDRVELEKAQAMIDRHAVRLRVASLRIKHRR